ncbi:MAG: HAMP domain-containing histidine kinase [Rhodospirillales bacterium]|nr:HAMP domain-containing histidine kinase [Rhodospirillales bacterium]
MASNIEGMHLNEPTNVKFPRLSLKPVYVYVLSSALTLAILVIDVFSPGGESHEDLYYLLLLFCLLLTDPRAPVVFASAITLCIVAGYSLGALLTPEFHATGTVSAYHQTITIAILWLIAFLLRLHKIQEQEMKAQRARLESLNLEKSRMFSIIAHDLKSPLNAVLGYTELIGLSKDKSSLETLTAYAARAHDAGSRLLTLLDSLLSWGRLHMEGTAFQPRPIHLAWIIDHAVQALSPSATQKNITIAVDVIENADNMIQADESMADTIVRNLVNNAIKFTPEGGTVTIHTAQAADRAGVTVVDSGPGIPPERMAKLFAGLSTPGTKGETGNGLGLSLCRDLAEKNGGTITAESALGEGTAFTLMLPTPPSADRR